MKILSLTESVISEDLDVAEHGLDHLLGPRELPLDLVAVVLGVLGMEVVYPLGLVLDPSLDVIELGVGLLGLCMNLLGQPLELLESLDLLNDHLVPLLEEHHELGPGSLDVVWIQVAVQLKVHVPHLAFKIFEDSK